MRIVARFALFAITAISLSLAVLAAAAWMRSYFRSDAIVYSNSSGHTAVQWARGLLVIGRDNVAEARQGLWVDSWAVSPSMTLGLSGGSWARWGFGLDRSAHSGGVTADRMILPLWSVVAVGAVTPLLRSPQYLRRRYRLRNGRCLSCGYDLRASTDRCPECGTSPATRPAG